MAGNLSFPAILFSINFGAAMLLKEQIASLHPLSRSLSKVFFLRPHMDRIYQKLRKRDSKPYARYL